MTSDNFGFAPPPFDAAGALVQLKRQLRDLKLSERGSRFELKGRAVVELAAQADHIDARIAKRASMTPEWLLHTLRSSADVRGFIDAVKRQMTKWSSDE
jgi:aspartate oxidase